MFLFFELKLFIKILVSVTEGVKSSKFRLSKVKSHYVAWLDSLISKRNCTLNNQYSNINPAKYDIH